MSRTAILVWLLAVPYMDSLAAESIHKMSVYVWQNVMLPCPCSNDTYKLVWQIGEKVVVNHCCEKKDPVHQSYVNRTQVFLSLAKGNCSLLLRDVTLNDENKFTCYVFDGEQSIKDIHEVELKVEDVLVTTVAQTHKGSQIDRFELKNYPELHTGFSVGVPLSLILVILSGLIVALIIRKHRERKPRMVVIKDLQAQMPIMNHTPV